MELRERSISLWQDEQLLCSGNYMDEGWRAGMEALLEDYQIFVRDLLAVLPYLGMFCRSNMETLRAKRHEYGFKASCPLFVAIADIFHCWFSSKVGAECCHGNTTAS